MYVSLVVKSILCPSIHILSICQIAHKERKENEENDCGNLLCARSYLIIQGNSCDNEELAALSSDLWSVAEYWTILL